jgi:C4-dicarboxylate-specific signal transduction histidine kinase
MSPNTGSPEGPVLRRSQNLNKCSAPSQMYGNDTDKIADNSLSVWLTRCITLAVSRRELAMAYMHCSARMADRRARPVREESPSQGAYARDTERQESESLTELTRVDRIAIIGRLAASIPHEVSQPITAMVTNAQAALRLLDCQAVNLEDVRSALASIVQDGNRACNVIGCMRALIKKSRYCGIVWTSVRPSAR